MLRRLYDWTMSLASHPRAGWALAFVSFIESSVFPIPPDVIMIPMVLAKRAKAWIIASIATVSSVIGGIAGYAIGYFLFEAVGQPLLDFYGYGDKFASFAGIGLRGVGEEGVHVRIDIFGNGVPATAEMKHRR